MIVLQTYAGRGLFKSLATRFRPCQHVTTRSFANLVISQEVQRALSANKPVVCLESTIITHGMAYPQNLEMAREVEAVIRRHGATPATIAILSGKAHVGLQDADLKLLALTGQAARKISRRDLAAVLADKATGGTTVSATMILAKRAGIKVFVTGGIGGVHRDGESTLDVSNDLNELSRNDVAVVCAGPKAILDIPRTLEYLETMGVTVTTVGQQNLPAFYSRDSGIKSPQQSPTPEHAAALIAANRSLALESAILVCVPIPESAGLDGAMMDAVIRKAVAESEAQGIKGKDSTPFLLAAVSAATKGRSLDANIALVMENARVGAQIAVHLADLESDQTGTVSSAEQISLGDSKDIADSLFDLEDGRSIGAVDFNGSSFAEALLENEEASFIKQPEADASTVLVIGGVAVDVTCALPAPSNGDLATLLFTSNPGKTTRSLGGVAANIASAIHQAGQQVKLVTAVGDDVDGSYVLETLAARQMDAKHVAVLPGQRTATYTNIQAGGQLVTAVADMDILHALDSGVLEESLRNLSNGFVIVDGNLSPQTFASVLNAAQSQNLTVCFEPTSVAKAKIAFDSDGSLSVFPGQAISIVTPNIHELRSLHDAARVGGLTERDDWWKVINAMHVMSNERSSMEHFVRQVQRSFDNKAMDLLEDGVMQQCIQLLPFMPNIYLTLGQHGVLSAHLTSTEVDPAPQLKHILRIHGQDCHLTFMHHPVPQPVSSHVTDTGAGDTFTGSLIVALARGQSVSDAVETAQEAAVAHLSRSAVQN